MGKSATARMLGEREVPVIDTDDIAREVVTPGETGWRQVKEAFGDAVIQGDEPLDRRALAQIVFEDSAKRELLESILHPLIRERWLGAVAGWTATDQPLGCVVIPLLFETGAEAKFGKVLTLACSSRTQHERLQQRGWSDESIQGRLAAQWGVDRKIALADYVIWTEPNLALHERQLDMILERCRDQRSAC